MAGDAGGREVGRISIRAVPSTGTFRQDLLAELRKIEADLPRITVGTDVDTTKLTAQVEKAVNRAQRFASHIDIKTDVDGKPLDDLGKKIDTLGTKAKSAGNDLPNLHLGLVGIGSSALSALPGVFSLAGSLEKVAGAYGLLPGLLEAAGAGVATLAVGLHGVKDALSSKTEADPVKYAAAIANLAPSARKAVAAINDLNPTLHTLQQNVQQSLFAGLSTQIERLGKTLIPVLNQGMVGIAHQANLAATAFGQFASSAGSVRDLGSVFANVTTGFHNLLPAVQPLLTALRDLGAVSASFLPQLGSGISHAAASFSTFVATARQTGQLRGWITEGITAVKQLGSIAGSVLKTFQGIVSAAQSVGGGTLGGLAAVLKSVATTVNGPAFQTGLRQFFTGLQAGFAALSSAMPALGSAVAALGPPLAALTQGIGQTLAQAIQALAPAIVQMAPALTTLAQSLASLTSAAISTVAPVLTLIAKAASFIVQDVPGAATALGALGVALLALKGANAVGLAVDLGKLSSAAKSFAGSSVALGSISTLKAGFNDAQVASSAFSGKLGTLGGALSRFKPVIAAVGTALPIVGGAIAAVGVTALIVNAHVNKMRDAIDNASEAAGRLKGSMDSGKSSLNAFVTANQRAIVELRNLDAANQKAYLVQIGFDLINEQGYTPKQAFAAVQQLASAAGITLPVTLTIASLSDAKTQLAAIKTTAVEAAKEIDQDPFGSWSMGAAHANEQIKGIATSANDALNSDNWAGAVSQINAFQHALGASNVPITAQDNAIQRLNRQFLQMTGYQNLSTSSTNTLGDTLRQLSSDASGAPQPLKDYAKAVLAASAPTGDLATGIAAVAQAQKDSASDMAHAHVALSNAGVDMTNLANTSKATASAAAVAASNVKLLAAAYVALNSAITQSIGGNIGMKAAQADVINQAVTLAQQMKKNGDSLSLASAKGRENVAVVNSLAQSFVTAAAATIKWDQDHHKSTTAARADLEKLRQSLVTQMIQAGVSRAEAKKLADTYLKMPKTTVTEAKFNAAKAKADAKSYKTGLEHTWSLLAGDASSAGVLAGKNLADGVAAGIASKMAYVNQKSAQMGEESVAAFNHAVDSRSPSRKMILAGKNMGDGLIIGLDRSIAGASAAATRVANAALSAVSASLKTQPTTREGLSTQYGTLRATMLATAQASATAAGFYSIAQTSVTKAKNAVTAASAALSAFTKQTSLHNAAVSASVAQARQYLTSEIAVDRQHKASKATIAALEKQLHDLSSSHTTAAATAKLAATITKNAYQDQVKAAQAVTKAAQAQADALKKAADKAKQAAEDAATAAKDTARALVDVLQQEANDLAQSISSFRDQMTQAIQGGGIDFTKLILDADGNNGGLGLLQVNLDEMLTKTKNFSADLQALAKAGASQDLITQIVGLGPDAGDALAQQLLAGGDTAITSLNDLMKQIQDAAGAGAQNLTDVFYKPGADAIENFIKGLQKAFPELKVALQQIIDYVESSLAGMTTDVSSATAKAKATAISAIAAGGGEGSPSQITKTTKLGVVGAAANHAAATVGAVAFAPDVVAAVQENTAATRELLAVTAGSNEKFLILKRTGAI